ncbi:MAG: VCBS repeat-containing protein [Thermoguttaceae bacterium]|jgi:hypothetical protein
MLKHVAETLWLALALFSFAATAAERAQDIGFTDVTRSSGLEQIVADNYAAHPKWWLSGLHLVDLDGDGHLDLFLSAHGTAGALAALNDGKGHFRLAPGQWPATEIHLAYDFDEDGKVDLTMTHGDGGAQWWRNLSRPGQLRFEPTGMIRGDARRQAMIDIDRDGRVDWLHGGGDGIHFNLADRQGRFVESGRTLRFGGAGQNERLCLPVDIDGDGRIDLLSEWGHYASPEGNSRIWRNEGGMNFRDVTAAAGLPEKGLSIKGVGDLCHRGCPDLICIENKQLVIYLNDGRGHFAKKEGAIVGGQRGIAAPSWGAAIVTDFDNDGIPDILVNGRYFLKIYRGTGDGRFVYMNDAWGIQDLSAAAIDDGLCFGDIHGNGKFDIVGYRSIGDRKRVAVYRNDLPARHWINVRPVGLPGNRGAAGAKIRLYVPGAMQLLWYEQVAIFDSQAAASYYSFAQTERHFGLGPRTAVDVSVEFYPSGKLVWQRAAPANTTVVVRE